MSDIIESMAKAIEADLMRQYEANSQWDDAKDVVENIDANTLTIAAYAAALAHLEKPSDRMIQSGLEEYMTTNVKDISVNGTCSRIFTAMIRAAK